MRVLAGSRGSLDVVVLAQPAASMIESNNAVHRRIVMVSVPKVGLQG